MHKFSWWEEWLEKKKKYGRVRNSFMEQDQFKSICVGTGLPPIHQKSTFPFNDVNDGAHRFLGMSPDGEKPYARIYTRLGNPNTEYLEKVLFRLECQHFIDNALAANEEVPGIGCLVFSSGMGAISSVIISLINSGDSIVLGNVYGCTDSLVRMLERKFQIKVYWLKGTDPLELQDIISRDPKVKAVLIESPANPTLEIYDIEAFSRITEPNEVILIVDNTFCTPYLQQPFRLGADIVIHSLTKYINGHSSSIGGVAIGPWGLFSNDLFMVYKDLGPTPSPFDSWLNSLTLQDLPLRVSETCRSAQIVAEFLSNHPLVSKTIYPGFKDHPQYELAQKQMRKGGGMISFEVAGGYDAGVKLMNYFTRVDTPMKLAVSLGSVISYIQHPSSMTHSIIPESDRYKRGITDALVRLSVGCEGESTLTKALEEGLQIAHK